MSSSVPEVPKEKRRGAIFAAIKRFMLYAVVLVAGAGVGAGVIAATMDFLDKRPATIVKAAFDANSVTYRDGRIQLYFWVTKVRDCPTTTTRWLWTWVNYNGQKMRLFMPLGVGFTGPTEVGTEPYLLSLQVPWGVWDGDWYFYARDTTSCGGLLSLLRNQVSEIPSIPIHIQGTSEQPPAGVVPALPPPPPPPPPQGIPEPKAEKATPPRASKKLDPYRRSLIVNGEPLP